MSTNNDKPFSEVIKGLTPTEEHFLKKYLLENRLSQELHYLSSPEICEWLGPPFKVSEKLHGGEELPLLSFFFRNLVTKFPFVASNTAEEQQKFWESTVQPFVKSINSKRKIKQEMIPKSKRRRYVNKKMLSGLLIFYNSMLVTAKDMIYLQESHLKTTQNSKLEKLQNSTARDALNIHLSNYHEMKFLHDININIVAVRRMVTPATTSRGWFGVNHRGPRHNFEFVVQVTTRTDDGKQYIFDSHFISRPYSEFRKLEKELKASLPGIMSTKIFPIGNKVKHDDGGCDSDDSSSIVSQGNENRLFREKQRLALRGWITALLEYPEVIHSQIFQRFIDNDLKNFDRLEPSDLEDHENRIAHERHIIKTQQEFQNQTVKVMSNLSTEFESLKSQLVKNPNALNDFYNDLGNTREVEKSESTLIQSFNDWCKIEVAATIYQWFLGSDRSAPVLAKCVRFNRLIPHSLIYNILRFTNPVKIVSRMLDLLFLPLPSISLPKWGKASQEETQQNQNAGARNMISIAFVMLLEDDLNNYEKELKILEEGSLPPNFTIFTQRIKAYFELPYETCQEIQDESYSKSQDLLLTVLSTDSITPRLSTEVDKLNFDEILNSYTSYQNLADSDNEDIELYVALKQYWQLELNSKDKAFFKSLWQDGETTKFIKGFMVIFYKPLLELMNKAQMHVAYRDMQKFMEEILQEMVNLNNGEKYYLDPITLLNRIVGIITKHENCLWRFINNIYSQDERELFKGLITWISKFLELLRIKYTDLNSVDLKLDEIDIDIDIDNDLFLQQLTSRTEKIIAKRQLFKDYVKIKAELANQSTQEQIDSEWETIHEKIMGENSGIGEFGIDVEDLEEFNNMNNEQDFDTEEVGALERQLRLDLYKLDHESDCGTSELDKLDDSIKIQLKKLFLTLEEELQKER